MPQIFSWRGSQSDQFATFLATLCLEFQNEPNQLEIRGIHEGQVCRIINVYLKAARLV